MATVVVAAISTTFKPPAFIIFAAMAQPVFRHTSAVQIRFCDLDSLNHVNNANYLSYVELARINYLQQVLGMDMNDRLCVILAKATVDYLRPILLSDTIEVRTRCARIGNKSFDLEYQLVKTGEPETIMATAYTVLVAFDYELNTPIPVLDDWKQKMEAFDATA